jgi:hypothetical protein
MLDVPMIYRTHCLIIIFAACLTVGQARGQESQPPATPDATGAKDPAASGPEKKYEELTHSKDSKVRGTADRYLNLIKFREWGDASGKTTVVAKYISHEPDLKRVKLSIAKGSGKERTYRDVDVVVEKLSKTCQARVKQIDFLQKKLDEMLANGADKPEAMAGQGGPERANGPASDRYGRNRHSAGAEDNEREHTIAAAGPAAMGPAATTATSPESDPSASEPDPIGFADLPPVAPSVPAVGPGGIPVGPGGVPVGPGARPAGP